MRGEYLNHLRVPHASPELPPRARRILLEALAAHNYRGTTSACAENTRVANPCKPRFRNYLRVRGEYSPHTRRGGCGRELPPRARRIRLSAPIFPTKHGTTSACAENTSLRTVSSRSPRNYLRVRGEYGATPYIPPPIEELPPRARRIPDIKQQLLFWPGNYLRVRGEYRSITKMHHWSWELPPRARRIHTLDAIYYE